MLFLHLFYRLRATLFGPPDLTIIVRGLVDSASRKAFRIFRDSQFRDLVVFDTLEQTEQDRMFNELLASNLVLAMLMLDTFVKVSDSDRTRKQNIRTMLERILEQFIQLLENTGVAKEHTQIWLKLLNLRRDEYEQTRLDYRDKFVEFSEGNPWVRVVAVGCLFHIRRGKAITKDPLIELFIKQAIDISEVTRKAVQLVVFSG